MASSLEASGDMSESAQNGLAPDSNSSNNADFASTVREKAKDLSLDLKNITQLYNEYAVPFELWEVHRSSFFILVIMTICIQVDC